MAKNKGNAAAVGAQGVLIEELPYIAEGLRPLAVPIDSLVPDPDNARLHPEDNMQAIERSLAQFGQDQPLVVQKGSNVVRKGNGRLAAAKRLGWTHVAVVFVEEDDIDSAARAIADNRSAELAQWDDRVLLATMQRWQEQRPEARATDLGFREDQLAAIAARMAEAEQGPQEMPAPTPDAVPPEQFPSFDENIPTEHQCPKCNYRWSGGS